MNLIERIERLRKAWDPSPELILEAADEIERLTAENAALKAEIARLTDDEEWEVKGEKP